MMRQAATSVVRWGMELAGSSSRRGASCITAALGVQKARSAMSGLDAGNELGSNTSEGVQDILLDKHFWNNNKKITLL